MSTSECPSFPLESVWECASKKTAPHWYIKWGYYNCTSFIFLNNIAIEHPFYFHFKASGSKKILQKPDGLINDHHYFYSSCCKHPLVVIKLNSNHRKCVVIFLAFHFCREWCCRRTARFVARPTVTGSSHSLTSAHSFYHWETPSVSFSHKCQWQLR